MLIVLLLEGPSKALHVLLVLAGPESAVVQAQAGGELVEALLEELQALLHLVHASEVT